MASIIRVRRSTGTVAPPNINYGELGLTVGVGTHGNGGGRIYAGDNNSPSSNPQVVGGRYYTDLLSIYPGKVAGQDNPTTPANGFVPIMLTENPGNPGGTGNVTRLPRVDQFSVDNLTFDGNTIYSNNTDGHINFATNGAGEVIVPDDTKLTFGTSQDSKIEYDEDGTDHVLITGADWRFMNNLDVVGVATFKSKAHFLDSDELHFGGAEDDAGDLQISHSGTHSYIKDVGTGHLRVTSSIIDIRNSADNASMIAGYTGAGVSVFYNGNQKLRTTNDGVIITGICTADSFSSGTPGQPGAGSTFYNGITVYQGAVIDNIGIHTNLIRSTSGNQLFIDPYPDGLSNEGTVIIKGDLQVDGTQTIVNSTAVSVNEAIFDLSNVTSQRTVLTAAAAAATTIVLDSVVGIQVGDDVSGTTALTPSGGLTTAITAVNTGAKTISIATGLSAGIATNTQLTVTHAKDTNTDKGISFNYNTGVGTANNQKGFFGYLDTAPTSTSDAPARSWTYIPDATITNDVVTGNRGSLDIGSIYYQGTSSGSGGWYESGAAYFDANGKLTSTVNPAGGITTSNYVLTTNSSGIPTWTTTIDGGEW